MQNDEGQFNHRKEQSPNKPEYTGGTYGKVQRQMDGMEKNSSAPAPSSPEAPQKKEGMEKTDVSSEGFVLGQEETQPETEPTFKPTPSPTTPSPKTEIPKSPPPPPFTPKSRVSFPRWLKFLIIIILAVLVLAALYIFIFYKATLEASVNQSGTKITIDGKSAVAGLNKVRPGRHELKIEKEGFVNYVKEIEVKYFKKTTISVILKEIPEITLLYEKNAQFPAYNKERDLYLFYVKEESAFYRVEANKLEEQSKEPILTSPHYVKNLVDVIWNPDRLTAIFKIKNDSAALVDTPFYKPGVAQNEVMTFLYDFGRYDLLNQEASYWGIGFGDIKFTPKGDQVAYFYEPGTGEKSLVVALKDNSNLNRIADLRNFENPKIGWSADLKNIVITNRSSNFETNKIYIFNLIDKSITEVTDFGQNIEAVFDPKGEKIIYSTFSSDPDFTNYSLLSMMDKDGGNKKELKARSYLEQSAFITPEEILVMIENNKDQYIISSINLSNLKKTDYIFKGSEIVAPDKVEYIESKNSIIFSDENKVKLIFLTTNEYE